MALLQVSGISKQQGTNLVVKDITFSQAFMQKIAIAGASGSGKSTVLKIIAGYIQPDGGEVLFDNKKVIGPDEKLIPGHQDIGYLSQHFELRNNYRVEELLDYASKIPPAKATWLYELCKISHLLHRRTDQLSGGEKQRIALAGLLTRSPRLLLLDEPFSNLDTIHKNQLKSVIQNIGQALNITCMLVSHDPADLLSWADKVLVMEKGCIIQRGSPRQVYFQPQNAYVAELFGAYTIIQNKQLKSQLGITETQSGEWENVFRPESFLLNSDKEPAVEGKLTGVNFKGGYYDLAVAVKDQKIVVRTLHAPAASVGDDVTVALNPQVKNDVED